jgi:hypothetical protein
MGCCGPLSGRKITTSCYETPIPKRIEGNPDPKNYKIGKIVQMNNLLIVKINYPDCKNYEGDKILIFEDVSLEDLMHTKIIDPHFTNALRAHIVPIARFKPDDEGMNMAITFARFWKSGYERLFTG